MRYVRRALARRLGAVAWIGLVIGGLAACAGAPATPAATSTPAVPAPPGPSSAGLSRLAPTPSLPGRPAGADHIVVVVLENKASTQLDGSPAAPYLNGLMAGSAVLTNSHAITHPSEPNYLALFSGSTHGVTDDRCPLALGDQPNLARQLIDAGRSFTGYSEGLPRPGYTGCSSGRYAAKHNPWNDFSNVPGTASQPFTAFPADFTRLPTVAFVIPDLCNDMHDCSIATGDSWMRDHLDGYAHWARAHNSLLIVTFDENDNSPGNQILTFISGASVRPGRYSQRVDHYGVLATIEDRYGLPRLGSAAGAAPITGIWA